MSGSRRLLAVGLICIGYCFATPNLPGADVAGVWVADDPTGQYWLVLEQNGTNLTGTYTLQDGQVFGSIRDGVVRLSWRQEHNRRGGSAILALSQDQQVLSGPWQYDPKVFNSGLTGGGTWTFHRATDDPSSPSPKSVAPSPNKPLTSAPPQRVSFTFDQFNPGPISVDAFATQGAQIIPLQGTPMVNNAGPEMVLPGGRSRVLMIGGGPVTSVTFSFDRPFGKFSLTRIGVVNGASVPTWKLEALDRDGRVLDSVGEIHGLYQQPRKIAVQGINITDVRLSTDNRAGAGTWATYNSLPVVEFEIERVISSPGPREKSPTPPPPFVTTTPRSTPPLSTPSPTPRPTPPIVTTPSPPPVTPQTTAPPLPTRTPTAAPSATSTPSVKPSSPLPASPTASASPSASATSTKEKPRPPQVHGKPEAVIAAVKKSPPPAAGGAHDEIIADGAFIVQRPDSWQVSDTTDNSAMFVSQDLPNAGVLFEWDSDKPPASAESVRELKQEHPDLESLPNGQMGSAPASRYAWVEAAEPERREALYVSWNAGDTAMHATAIAPAAAWEKYPEKILALLNGRTGERHARKPKPKSTPTPTESPTPTTSATPSPSASPTPTRAPLLTAAAAVAESKSPAPSSGEVQNQTIADGALTIHYDDSWKISDSGNSYLVLAMAKPPELTVWIQWSDGKGKSLDQVANEAMAKLRARYDVIDALPNRTIAGAPARQVAWLTSEENKKSEHLQLDWIQHDTLLRATIVASPDVWRTRGPQVLRLLEDLTEGGG